MKLERTMTKKRIENLAKKADRDAELAKMASLGGALFGDHRPLKWQPFRSISIKF